MNSCNGLSFICKKDDIGMIKISVNLIVCGIDFLR